MKLTMINALITIDIIFIITSFVSHWCEIAPEHTRTKKMEEEEEQEDDDDDDEKEERNKQTNTQKKNGPTCLAY